MIISICAVANHEINYWPGTQKEQAEHGKTELSLINFSIRNPAWQPKENEAMYISTIKALGELH